MILGSGDEDSQAASFKKFAAKLKHEFSGTPALRRQNARLRIVPPMLALGLVAAWSQGANAQETMPPEPAGQTLSECPSSSVEQLTGTAASDQITAWNADSCVVAGEGNDIVDIGLQADRAFVLAGEGDDSIFGGAFAHDTQIAAGPGQDNVSVGLKATTVWGQEGDDAILGGPGNDRVDGGAGNDEIRGSWGDDLLVGSDGDDILEGGSGSDRLLGGAGDDVIKADTLFSLWFGDDYIMPGPGKDLVWAGEGEDTVVLYDLCEVEAGEQLLGGIGNDTLISPVSLEALEAAGVSVHGFEEIRIEQNSCASDCVVKPDCNGRGECKEGASSGEVLCQCEERFAGDDCSLCSERFSGEDCEDCSNRYEGPNCEDCRSPFTGENCMQCEAPWQGPNCDQCPDRRIGPKCESCAYPFTGPDCQSCLSPHAGPECKTCTNGMFGEGCNECDPNAENQCSGIADCVPIGDSGAGRCDCPSGRVGPDCSGSVQELSIQWNEPPSTFEMHRLPGGEEIGERSASWLIPIQLESNDASCEYTRDLPVDKAGLVAIAVSSSKPANVWEIEVQSPDGTLVAPESSHSSPEDEAYGSQRSVAFNAPTPGLYKVRVVAAGRPCSELPTTEGEMQLLVENSEQILYTNTRGLATYRGNTVLLEARMIDKASSPPSSEPYEPTALPGAIYSATVRDRKSGTTFSLFDDGTHGDRVAGDSIFSRSMPLLEKGVAEWQIEVNQNAVLGSAARSQSLRLNVVERALARTRTKPVKFYDGDDPPLIFDFEPIPSEELGRISIQVPIQAVGLEIPETDAEWDRFRINEYVVSAELHGITPDGREFPIAWISGIELPVGFAKPPLYSSSVVNEGFFSLEVDHRWFTNVRELNNVSLETMNYELRRLRVVDRKSSVLIDLSEQSIPVQANGYRRLVLQTVEVPRLFDVDDPEFVEMLKGAESDFVTEIKNNVTAGAFPKLRGNVLLVAGYCGRADERWRREEMLDMRLDTPDGQKLRKRVLEFSPWFGRLGGGNANAVSVATFSDELLHQLGPSANADFRKVAQIWGMSQGGIAAVDMHSRHNALYAYRDQMKARGLPSIHTVASAFLGTPLADVDPLALLSRVGSWIKRDCTPASWAALVGADFISYTHLYSAIRTANIPASVRQDVQYGRVRHGKGWLGIKAVCSFIVSRFMLFGWDDGLVQSWAATLSGAKENESMGDIEGYCHAERGAANLYWKWMLDSKQGLKWSLCQRSFLPELNPALDCFFGQK